MNCPHHPSNELSVICIAPHNCQRKYCPECQYEHGGEVNQYLPMDVFQTKLKSKAQTYQLNDDQEQVKQQREFKILLANTQIHLKQLFQELNQSIEGINNTLKKKAQVYLNLINYQYPLSESSYSDLDIMVKILEGDLLEQLFQQKDYYFNYLHKLKSELKSEIEKFINTLNQQFSEVMQEEKIQKFEGLIKQGQILKKTNFHIHFTQQRGIKYLYQGEILYNFIQHDLLLKPPIITNIEKIKHLRWAGKEGKNQKKNGLWSAYWKNENCNGCGGEYTLDGNKRGQWKEMITNYYDNAKVYEVGEYVNDVKTGTWKYIFNDQEIGGGQYNSSSKKDGKWIELSEGFNNKSQVTSTGQYKNNKKVGRWNTVAWGQEFGGGSYDEEGHEIKIGLWTELNNRFSDYSQVFFIGEYKNEQKIGKWTTWWNIYGDNKEIGGGSYDQKNNGMKIGKWIELSDEFSYLSQVTYHGEYQNGKKVGKWDIMYKKINDLKFNQIGGGSFDSQGQGIKIGKWVELIDGFGLNGQVTYNGEYQNGKKVGRWNIVNCGVQMGGGSYNEGGEIKIGRWIELNDGFWDQSQVFYDGEYKNDKKVGKWDIFLQQDKVQKQIGYGSYDDDGYKIGKWVELDDQFQNCSQILYIGHFKKGSKIGRWDIAIQGQLIGGGTYDEQNDNMKVGEWIELVDGFQNCLQVFYNGSYKYGNKVGKWDISVWGQKIGGGKYDEQNNGIKIGEWIELSDGFSLMSQVIYKGEYKNSKKIGRWDIMYKAILENQYKKIGGGSYDEKCDGLKTGNWIELIEGFGLNGLSNIKGEYKNGKKFGTWMMFDILKNQKVSEKNYGN